MLSPTAPAEPPVPTSSTPITSHSAASLTYANGAGNNTDLATVYQRLKDAVCSGDMKKLMKLGSTDESLLARRDPQGTSLLLHAVANGKDEIARHLLKLGAHPNDCNDYGWNPLSLSAFHGHLSITRLLLVNPKISQPPPHTSDSLTSKRLNTVSPLLCAVYRDHEAVARLLLDAGVSPDGRANEFDPVTKGEQEVTSKVANDDSEKGKGGIGSEGLLTPLMVACLRRNLSMVSLLLRYRVGVNIHCRLNGWTALMYAIAGGIDAGEPPDDDDHRVTGAEEGKTEGGILPSDGSYDSAEVVRLLLEHGANPKRTALNGMSAVMFAEREGKKKILNLLTHEKWIVQASCEKNLPLFAEDVPPRHPIFELIHSNDVTSLQEMLNDHPTSFGLVDPKDGSTPLIVAASKGYYDCARILVEHMVDRYNHPTTASFSHESSTRRKNPLDIRDESAGWTALMHASYNNYPDLVQLLIDHDSNVFMRSGVNGGGCTAREIASVRHAVSDVVILLEDAERSVFPGRSGRVRCASAGNPATREEHAKTEAEIPKITEKRGWLNRISARFRSRSGRFGKSSVSPSSAVSNPSTPPSTHSSPGSLRNRASFDETLTTYKELRISPTGGGGDFAVPIIQGPSRQSFSSRLSISMEDDDPRAQSEQFHTERQTGSSSGTSSIQSSEHNMLSESLNSGNRRGSINSKYGRNHRRAASEGGVVEHSWEGYSSRRESMSRINTGGNSLHPREHIAGIGVSREHVRSESMSERSRHARTGMQGQYTVDLLLRSLDLEKYTEMFEEHEINMDTFLVLGDSDLKEIGILPLGHRKQILAAISSCRADLQARGEYSSILGYQPIDGVRSSQQSVRHERSGY